MSKLDEYDKMVRRLRDYGLPDPVPVGIPVWRRSTEKCPNCKATACNVSVEVEVKGRQGMCRYLGCPACPWASSSVVTYHKDDDELLQANGDKGAN